MHTADALLSSVVGISSGVATLGAVGFAAKRLKEDPNERIVPLIGVLGVFVFAAQMINFTIPAASSSGHL